MLYASIIREITIEVMAIVVPISYCQHPLHQSRYVIPILTVNSDNEYSPMNMAGFELVQVTIIDDNIRARATRKVLWDNKSIGSLLPVSIKFLYHSTSNEGICKIIRV